MKQRESIWQYSFLHITNKLDCQVTPKLLEYIMAKLWDKIEFDGFLVTDELASTDFNEKKKTR